MNFNAIRKICLLGLLILNFTTAFSQVGINTKTPDPSAVLELKDTERGFLIPRMTTADRQKMELTTSPPIANSLLVFDVDHKLFYYWDATDKIWKVINPWTLEGSYPNNINNLVFNGSGDVVLNNPASDLLVAGSTTTTKLTADTVIANTVLVTKFNADTVNANIVAATNLVADTAIVNIVRARTNAGIQLFDVAGNGIFVEDGGSVGFNKNNPNDRVDINGDLDITGKYKIGDQVVLTASTGWSNSNLFVGINSGTALNKISSENVFLGNGAAAKMKGGTANVMIGQNAGLNSLDLMYSNIFIGREAGMDVNDVTPKMLSGNVYVGDRTGQKCSGNYNVMLGFGAGKLKTKGDKNVFLGDGAGFQSGIGSTNIFIGEDAGVQMGDGDDNICFGQNSGGWASGDQNILIGYRSGLTSKGKNIIIGNDIDVAGTNQLAIGNGTALISGDFTYRRVTINGDFATTGSCAGCASDSTLKTNIQKLQKGSLEKIARLNGYTYLWKENTSQYGDDKELQIGLMAQEVQKEFPLLVDTAKAGHLYIDYQKMVVPLVESVKELNSKLNEKDQQIQELKEILSALKTKENENGKQIHLLEAKNSELEEKEKQIENLESRLAKLEQLLLQNQ